jgi:hypothetical protein
MLSAYNQTTLNLIEIFIGMAIIGSIIGIAWYRVASPSNFDRDTIFFIIKMFTGLAVVMTLVALLLRYT